MFEKKKSSVDELQEKETDVMDILSKKGEIGMGQTIPEGMKPHGYC